MKEKMPRKFESFKWWGNLQVNYLSHQNQQGSQPLDIQKVQDTPAHINYTGSLRCPRGFPV